MKKYIGKLGGYTIAVVVMSWAVLSYGPALIDSAHDGAVVIGVVLYVLWFTALAMVSVDFVRTAKKIRSKK